MPDRPCLARSSARKTGGIFVVLWVIHDYAYHNGPQTTALYRIIVYDDLTN